MKTYKRHKEYVEGLLELRRQEERKIDPIHETGDRFTSPPGATTLEENRILTEYMEQVNLQRISNALPQRKKPLLLKKFFKMKRNQQVDVYLTEQGNVEVKSGKVSAIGRDFVMLNNLTYRIWIPYHSIESANIPQGVPTYTNSHQFFIYDNNLKSKLLTQFGETVSKRDVLVQQFFEETLMTNLRTWKGNWVKVLTSDGSYIGKIDESTTKYLTIVGVNGHSELDWQHIKCIYSLRFLNRLYLNGWHTVKKLF